MDTFVLYFVVPFSLGLIIFIAGGALLFVDSRRHKRAADGEHLKAQTPLAIGAEAEPFAVFLVQAHLVEQVVGLFQIKRAPFLVPLGTRAVDRVRRRRARAGCADAKPERFVELIAVDAHRKRVAEILVPDPLCNFRIAFVRIAQVNRHVRAVECRVEADGVIALLRVFKEHRQFRQCHVTFLHIVLAGDGAQVRNFGVLGERHRQFVDVRQLIAFGIDLPKVRIAFHTPGRRVDRARGLPRRQHGQLGVERPVPAVLDVADPAVEAGGLRLPVHLLLRGELRQGAALERPRPLRQQPSLRRHRPLLAEG